MPHTKTIVTGLGAAAALAGAAFMQNTPEDVNLFDYGHLTDADYKFMAYVTDFGKSYGTKSEFKLRKQQFVERQNEIEAFNADPNNTHTLGHNLFSDRTHAEIKKLNGFKMSDRKRNPVMLDTSDIWDTVDWRDVSLNYANKLAVSPVKNQAECGSCWSFSTTGAVEGITAINTGVNRSFSEQQLISCNIENNGCNGGIIDYAFKYVLKNQLQLEGDYQYTSGGGDIPGFVPPCTFDSSKAVGKITGWQDVAVDKLQMKAAVHQQPVSVAINADATAFHAYKDGVITTGCGTKLDHAVLIVGYGVTDGHEYFLVKNSWGEDWGDQGYVKIGADNVCGILQTGSYPLDQQ